MRERVGSWRRRHVLAGLLGSTAMLAAPAIVRAAPSGKPVRVGGTLSLTGFLLDEVLSGLNPAEVDNAIRLVRAIRAQGATIVFVEHLMRAVVELSDRVAVLNEGKLFALGPPREVMRDPRVVSIYLGKAYAA